MNEGVWLPVARVWLHACREFQGGPFPSLPCSWHFIIICLKAFAVRLPLGMYRMSNLSDSGYRMLPDIVCRIPEPDSGYRISDTGFRKNWKINRTNFCMNNFSTIVHTWTLSKDTMNVEIQRFNFLSIIIYNILKCLTIYLIMLKQIKTN